MVRRLKKDVLTDLPDRVRSIVPMDIRKREEYQQALFDFTGWLEKNYRTDHNAVERASHAAAITHIGYLIRLTAKLKSRAVVDWINKFLEEYPNEKLVVFAVHRKMIDVIKRRINAKSVVIDGSVTGRNRHHVVDVFKRDKNVRVLIGNIHAAGVGVDGLQNVCSNLAFAELWWVPGVHTQAEGRIHRIGQKGTAWIYYMVAGGTIEEQLCKAIQTKQKIIHATLDGSGDMDDIDILDQLIDTME